MKKFIALIFILIFIILTPIVILFYNFKSKVFNADYYKQELVKNNFYNLALDEAFNKLFNSEQTEINSNIPFLSNDDLRDILKGTITPVWVQSEIEMVINEMFSWFKSEKDIRSIKVVIKLADLKNGALASLKSKIEEKFNTLPECSKKDIKKFEESSMQEMPTCRPPGFTTADLFKDFDVAKVLEGIPDEIDIVKVMQGEPLIKGDKVQKSNFNSEQLFENLTKVRSLAHIIFSAINYMFIILGLILIFIAVLTMNYLRSMFRWVGFPIFIVGIFLLAIFLAWHSIYNILIVNKLFVEGLTDTFSQTIENMITDFVSYLFSSIKIYGFIALILGIVLIVTSFIIKKVKATNN